MSDKKTDMTGLIVRKSPGFGIRSLGLKCCFYVQSSVDFGKLFSLDLIFLICKMGLPMSQMMEVANTICLDGALRPLQKVLLPREQCWVDLVVG